MNLLTNAFHAIGEEKGLIEISLNDLDLTVKDMAKYPNVNPGNYIELSVRDTGCGMVQNIVDRIFEPFFTTKKQGEGTGMGLAVVHGIIKSHGGFIFVYSKPLQGSIFQILLPKIENRIKEVKYNVSSIPKGKGRILFVDDDEDIVSLGQELLETLGYDFISRTASKEALEIFTSNPGEYDLIITEQSMPDMTGIKLTEEILKIRSDMPVILCTGFRDITSEEDFKEHGIRDIILKPIRLREIAEKINNILNNNRVLTA
jgi:CheY-like chemotaxis protein